MYNILDIARLVISKALEKKLNLNITRLHKYLYIIYGTYLVKYNEVISSEKPSCFETGPLFKTIQRDYKKNILNLNKNYENISKIKKDTRLNFVIDSILNHFKKYSASILANWTMMKGNAWDKAEKTSDFWGNDLNDDIKKDFKKVLKI